MKIENSHRRFNPLTGEWVLVSPQRTQRPWQGKVEQHSSLNKPTYDKNCYLCPNNKRANNEINPHYSSTFIFDNDFSSLKSDSDGKENKYELLKAKSEKGICRVVCFTPKHNVSLAELSIKEIEDVIFVWQDEYRTLGEKPFINHVQIFENKGDIMGCSNPHPHGQIWAQESIPNEILKEQKNQFKYYSENQKTLLNDYLQIEINEVERIVYENDSFILLVPFWAVWPFETMIIPKRAINNILQFTQIERKDFADIIKTTTVKYDNIFETSFPYSAGIHQSPTDGMDHEEWHLHMHFYPPLLRSATIKKFMVGYELLAEPQRDITPERSAEILRQANSVHYLLRGKNAQ
jgi:UDPglucose--hexose-1-phosphate uridylyltransferase